MEGANRAPSKEKSNPPGLDPEHVYPPDGESSTIDHIVREHLDSDLPELSREPGRPHSPQIKQEEELFDRVFSEDELVANILMRLKEEPDDQKLSPRDENETSSPVRIKEEEIDHKLPRPRIKLLLSSGRIKEESDAEGDKGPISQVFVDQNIKLEIGVKDEDGPHSPGSHPENPIKVVQGIDRLRGPWERSIAALSSPYCGVISKPSWESTRVYHK